VSACASSRVDRSLLAIEHNKNTGVESGIIRRTENSTDQPLCGAGRMHDIDPAAPLPKVFRGDGLLAERSGPETWRSVIRKAITLNLSGRC